MSEVKIDLNNLDKSSWKTYRFDEIAQNISERVDPNNTDLEVYVGLEHIDSESLHIKRHGTPEEVNGTKLRFYKGDIIFGRRRAYQRKAGIATWDGFCSAHALVLRANPDVIDPELFPFFMHSDLFMNRAVDISVGSLSPTINWGTLRHQEFLIPPKEIHRSIVELYKSSELVKNTQLNLDAKFDLLRETLINTKCFGKDIKEQKQTQIGSIPESWELSKLEDISVSITKGTTPSSIGHSFVDKGINFIKVESLTRKGSFIADKFEHITDDAQEALKRSQLKENDILFSIAGALGRTAIVNSEICPANTNQALSIIRLKEGTYPLFIYYFLKTNFIIQSLERLKVQAAQPNLSLKNIREFFVPVPPYDEQIKIATEIVEYDKISNGLNSKKLSFDELNKSISNKVF